jgi:hypothetical protein
MADQPESIFNNAPPESVAVVPPLNVDKYADLLKSIKNEAGGQKYDSVEKALEALGHSQSFIPQIKTQLSERETELERVKAELAQRESVEEVVQRLIANNQHGTDDPPVSSGLDEQAVMKLVQQTLTQTKQQEVVQSNQKQVQEALKAKFGDKAQEAVATKAAELGVSPSELGDLASKSPAMVLALFQATSQSGSRPTTPGVNIPALRTPQAPVGRPEKSLLSGATNREQKEFMQRVQAEVYAKHGIET